MTYVVSARRRYLKQDLPWRSVFVQGELPRLVLVTCGGNFDSRTRHHTDNVVVIATPVRQPVPDSAQTRPARVASNVVAEEQPFEVVQRFDQFELRRYPSHVVAEVNTRLPFDQAGNAAFRALFGYITGQNRSRTSVAMTVPVVQSAGTAEKVPMTAPVTQHGTDEGGYTVAFVLPASMTAQTAPEPTNPDVVIRTVLPTLAAATRYSGRSSRDSYERHLATLLEAIRAEGLELAGAPRLARFDAPFKPWFLRRNEVVINVVDNRESSDTKQR